MENILSSGIGITEDPSGSSPCSKSEGVSDDSSTTKDVTYTMDIPSAWGMDVENVMTVETPDELRRYYGDYLDEGGCPGTCSFLTSGGNLLNLEKQFDLLHKVAIQEGCTLDAELEEDLEDFMLYSGIGTNHVLELFYNDNLDACGLRYISYSGFDLWLGHYKYHSVFMKDDQIVEVSFPLFPQGVFERVDNLWDSFGYVDGRCDLDCISLMEDYYNELEFTDPLITETVETYDSVVSTLDLN